MRTFRHFQRNMINFVHSENHMIQKVERLSSMNIIPVLHMVSDRTLFEDAHDYHVRLQYEYEYVFRNYPNMFHVVNNECLKNEHGVRNTQNMISNAVQNNCKLIMNNDVSYNILVESRKLIDSCVYNFNTTHEANVYRMYDISSNEDYENLRVHVDIHKECDIYMGLVLNVGSEWERNIMSNVLNEIRNNDMNADIIIADDEIEEMRFVRIDRHNGILVGTSIEMNEIQFEIDREQSEPSFEFINNHQTPYYQNIVSSL